MPTCLFFCRDHALASRLAEAMFNAQAPRGWRSTSAGLQPAAAPDPRVAPTLTALGFRPPEETTRGVEKDLVSFMRVVIAVSVPADAVLPDWLAPKVDLKIDLEDPAPLSEGDLSGWVERLNLKLEPVAALCRDRTPRPFG